MESVHFVSLGCPKNLVDSEVMLGLLARAEYAFVEDPKNADIIIINTCAFIEDAKKEAIDTILEMAEFKKSGRCKLLAVAGCLPQRYENELADSLPEVDLFVGAGEFQNIVGLIRGSQKNRLAVARPVYLYDHKTPRITVTPPHAAYIKIAEGCFHPCSFCVIPKIRGRYRSRTTQSILEEAEAMLGRGVREINLIGQDTTAFGRDLGESLEDLLIGLSQLEGDKWIRVLYAYPHNFPAGVISAMKSYSDICPYLDIPVQHVSDRILKSMKREGDAKEIIDLIDLLRKEIPHIFLRTSVIVGYPGETGDEFDELLDFVSQAKFDHLGAFKYSVEEGTAAAKLQNRVSEKTIQRRYDEIMQLQQEISYDKNRLHVGKAMQVLVEGESEESGGMLQARHAGQAPEIDGVVYIKEGRAKAGDFALVKIKEFDAYDLTGDIVTTENVLREKG